MLVCLTFIAALAAAPLAHAGSADTSPAADASAKSHVTLNWMQIPRASRYIVMLARDAEMTNVFYSIETVQTTYVTPELPPGQYYYLVKGFTGETPVGQGTLQRFAVAAPVVVVAKKDGEPLPAPPIVGPKHMEEFPAYGKVRLAWEGVEGARAYRFRLYDETKAKLNARFKKDTPARWVTEVEHPWIEVRDAPYSSYMYLDTGTYRWDVAAIDGKTGKPGDVATGYFTVSRDWFLRKGEWFFRGFYGLSPQVNLQQNSLTTGQNTNLSSFSNRYGLDMDWWAERQWGANIGLGYRSFHAEAPTTGLSDTFAVFDLNADLLYRAYLSTNPWGWTLTLSAGLGMQEYPQVDQLGDAIHVSRPRGLGAKLGVRLAKRWQGPWELQGLAGTLLQAFTLNSPTGSATTAGSFDGDLTARTFYHWNEGFATGFGLSAESRKLSYTPDGMQGRSMVGWSGWYATLLVQLRAGG